MNDPSLPPENFYSIGPQTLRQLLFGFKETEFLRPTSPAPGDTAKVVCIPSDMGITIADTIDPNEEVFHIVFYPDDHAEVWQIKDWRESNALRNLTRAASTVRVETFNKDNAKLASLISKLKEQGYGARPGFAEQLAGQIYSDWQSGKYNSVLKLLNLMEILNEKEENKDNTTND